MSKLFNRADKYVVLPKNKIYVFCFKKKKIIEDEECDYYEHNLECDKKHDVWHRTHRGSSLSGRREIGVKHSMLNECAYCIKEAIDTRTYSLSERARKAMREK